MKVTDIQKDVCNAIIRQASFWRDSNDINSPTHYVDLEECFLADLDDKLSEKELQEFINEITNIFQLVKNLAEKSNVK